MLGLFNINEKMDVLATTGRGNLYKQFVEGLNHQYEQKHLTEHFHDASLEKMLQTTHQEALKTKEENVIDFRIGDNVFKGIAPEPQNPTSVQNTPSVPKIGF